MHGKYNNNVSESTIIIEGYWYHGDAVVIPMSILMVIFMIMSVGGNVMVILIIWRHKGMQTRTNKFLTSLAVADTMVGLVDMPLALVTLIKGAWVMGEFMCRINAFFVGLGLMTSVHTLMYMSILKCFSICRPFSTSMTSRKIRVMIAAAWLWGISYNMMSQFGWTNYGAKLGATQCGPFPPVGLQQKSHSYVNTLFNLIVPFSIQAFCYWKIFRTAKRQMNSMAGSTNVAETVRIAQQRHIAVTLFIVISCFFLCWCPYIIYSCWLVNAKDKDNIPKVLNPVAYWFGYMNSACNPVIYAFRSASFRQGYKELLCGETFIGDDLDEDSQVVTPLRKASIFFASMKSSSGAMLRRSSQPNIGSVQKRARSLSTPHNANYCTVATDDAGVHPLQKEIETRSSSDGVDNTLKEQSRSLSELQKEISELPGLNASSSEGQVMADGKFRKLPPLNIKKAKKYFVQKSGGTKELKWEPSMHHLGALKREAGNERQLVWQPSVNAYSPVRKVSFSDETC